MIDRTFVAWDGEGQGDYLVLMANSKGDRLRSKSGLGTEQVFDWLIKCGSGRRYANVWFGFSWDVNIILRDMPWNFLQELYQESQTFWNGYSIRWIPRHLFQVSKKGVGTFASYDTIAFFGGSFISALEEYKIPVPDSIYEGKAARSTFDTWSMDNIVAYNDEECRLLVNLMDRLRFSIKEADWGLRHWWGASALSAWFLEHHKVNKYIARHKNVPAERAYFGGRIEMAGWGLVEKAWHYDIASAYPAAMCNLPDLTTIRWQESKTIDEFSLVKLSWKSPWDGWGPFPYREYEGRILYPPEGRGWYWGVEILAARRRLGRRLRLNIETILTPSGDFNYPLRFPIKAAYNHRMFLKRNGDPAQYPVKIGLNALYGKMAQKQGYGGKPPRFRSYIWAGLITAQTRAMLSDLIDGNTLSTMTDSVFTSSPLDMPLSDDLGAWNGGECERLIQLQSGVYDYGGEPYSRGFEKDKVPSFEEVYNLFQTGTDHIDTSVTRFIGLGAAMQGRMKDWCKWVTSDRKLVSFGDLVETAGSKRTMAGPFDFDPTDKWHPLFPWPARNARDLSHPYTNKDLEYDTEIEREDEDTEED